MATRRPLIRVAGRVQQLPAGDTLAGVRASFGCTFDGGGADIAVGAQCDVRLPYACTLDKVSLIANAAGSLVVDIWVDTFANFPPTVVDSITASAKPTLSASAKYEDAVLTGWTKNLAAGSTVRFNVDSSSGVGRATLILEGVRT